MLNLELTPFSFVFQQQHQPLSPPLLSELNLDSFPPLLTLPCCWLPISSDGAPSLPSDASLHPRAYSLSSQVRFIPSAREEPPLPLCEFKTSKLTNSLSFLLFLLLTLSPPAMEDPPSCPLQPPISPHSYLLPLPDLDMAVPRRRSIDEESDDNRSSCRLRTLVRSGG